MNPESKTFPLAALLTVTTGRLLAPIDTLYDILGHMTSESPFTYQLGKFGQECKPWLLRWFPELIPCEVQAAMDSLDRWLAACDKNLKGDGIRMWLTEQKMMYADLKDEYEVPQIPNRHTTKTDPIADLMAMVGPEKVIVATV